MALTNNPLLKGASGRIGNLVIKQTQYGTVITAMPEGIKKKPTRRQKLHRDMFAAAIKYAKGKRRAYMVQHGIPGKAEGHKIYLAAIKYFIKMGREAYLRGEVFTGAEKEPVKAADEAKGKNKRGQK